MKIYAVKECKRGVTSHRKNYLSILAFSLNTYNCNLLLASSRPLARQLPILYNTEKKEKSSDVRLKTGAVDCGFYIRAIRGTCECTWIY